MLYGDNANDNRRTLSTVTGSHTVRDYISPTRYKTDALLTSNQSHYLGN